MKVILVGEKLSHVDGRTDVIEVIVIFCSFMKEPEKK
jgi:hypothetical protein